MYWGTIRMKKHVLVFLSGMLAALSLCSLSALALSSRMTIEVDPISVQVNGEIFIPRDVTGQEVPVFSYNGTTYAPLRALAEAYGLVVGYDPEKNMATVTSGNAQAVGSAQTPGSSEPAQAAYDLIHDAEALCKRGMNAITAAWHFGIWNAADCTPDTVIDQLAAQIGYDSAFVAENSGCSADELINGNGSFDGWEFCLTAAENCISQAGVHDRVKEALNTARETIQSIPGDHANYQDLKNYYTKVAAYADYFRNINGSYNDIVAGMASHELLIQTAKEPLLFDLG